MFSAAPVHGAHGLIDVMVDVAVVLQSPRMHLAQAVAGVFLDATRDTARRRSRRRRFVCYRVSVQAQSAIVRHAISLSVVDVEATVNRTRRAHRHDHSIRESRHVTWQDETHSRLLGEIAVLSGLYPGTTIVPTKWTYVVRVPRVQMPDREWRAFIVAKKATAHSVEEKRLSDRPSECTMLLHIPPGFPGASPRHFWTEETIRSARRSYERPHYAVEHNMIPGYDGVVGTHFFWSPQAWNPNSDGLIRYFYTMRMRLKIGFAREHPNWA